MGEGKLAELGATLLALLEGNGQVDIARTLRGLRARTEEARELAAELKSEIDGAIRRALVLQVNRNRNFLDELADFLDTLGESPERQLDGGDVQDVQDEEDEEGDDEEEGTFRTGRRGAEIAYRRALRMHARAVASGRAMRKGATTERTIEWIGNRGLDEGERMKGCQVCLVTSQSAVVCEPREVIRRRYCHAVPRLPACTAIGGSLVSEWCDSPILHPASRARHAAVVDSQGY